MITSERLRRVLIGLCIAGACAIALAPMLSQAQPSTALAKPCWPEDSLRGRDTAFAAFPCNDLRALPIGMQAGVNCTLNKLRAGGWDPLVFETWRSARRVAYLYSFGRTRPGRKVTNASNPLNAPHYWGYGVDIIHRTRKWDHPRFFYWVGQHAESCGLVAGVFWKSFPDAPHVQFAMYESERQRPPTIARLMREGKRDSVWLLSGAVR